MMVTEIHWSRALDQDCVSRMVGTDLWFEALCFVLRKLTAVQQVWVVAGSGRKAGHRLWSLLPPIPSEAASSLGLPSFCCALTGLMAVRSHPHGAPEAGHSLPGLLAELRGLRCLLLN